MSEEIDKSKEGEEDSKIDAIVWVAIILILTLAFSFWVSSQ